MPTDTDDLSCRFTGVSFFDHDSQMYNKNRNYLGAYAAAGELDYIHIPSLDDMQHMQSHGLSEQHTARGYYDFAAELLDPILWTKVGWTAEPCPIGWISTQLERSNHYYGWRTRRALTPFQKNATMLSLSEALRVIDFHNNIELAMISGWPIFHLIWRFAATLTLGRHRKRAEDVATFGNLPVHGSHLEKHLENIGSSGARKAWAQLAEEQHHLLRGGCPNGSFATLILGATSAIHSPHRMCVRWAPVIGIPVPSIVDVTILNHGAWPDCVHIPFHFDSPRDCTLLDIGANIGACTAWAVSQGHAVIAVEPMPENMDMLRATARLLVSDAVAAGRALPKIHVVQAAATEFVGSVSMTCPNGSDRSQCQVLHGNQLSLMSVPSTSVDSLLKQVSFFERVGVDNWPPVCALKLDVEGSELKSLRGARGTLAMPEVRTLHFEFLPELLESAHGSAGAASEVLDIVRSHGFSVYTTDAVDAILQGRINLPPDWRARLGEEVRLIDIPRAMPGYSLIALKS